MALNCCQTTCLKLHWAGNTNPSVQAKQASSSDNVSVFHHEDPMLKCILQVQLTYRYFKGAFPPYLFAPTQINFCSPIKCGFITCWLGNWQSTDVMLLAYWAISFLMDFSTLGGIRPETLVMMSWSSSRGKDGSLSVFISRSTQPFTWRETTQCKDKHEE